MIGGDILPALSPDAASHPRVDRRLVSLRWLCAIALIGGCGGGLLTVGLVGCMSGPKPAMPVFAQSDAVGPVSRDTQREDRLGGPRPQHANAVDRTEVEQLGDNRGDLRRYTHVAAHLGRRRPRAAPAVAADAPSEPHPASAGLPPEILFGASHPVRAPALTAYAEASDSGMISPPPLGEPVNVSTVPRQTAAPVASPRVVMARRGDGLATILLTLGLSLRDAAEAATRLCGPAWFGADTLQGGETIVAETAPDASSRIRSLRFTAPGSAPRTVALADDGHYRSISATADGAGTAQRAAETRSDESQPQSLREALAGLATADGLDAGLVGEAARLCGHDVDLESPVTADDAVELLSTEDEHGQPEVAYVGLDLNTHRYRYYRFTAADDASTDYYDAAGRSVTAFLLRKPVATGRLGDGFGWRVHPVLGDRRFHEGVDYAAPYGSPIAAAGAGTVEKIDQEWGYGKYIRVRHDLGYETTYAHVAGVPRGLAVGQRVRQGQTIAFVGSTGLSTGPHLYYEVKINGRNVDPLRVRLAGGRVLSGAELQAFEQARADVDLLLQAKSPAMPARP